MCTNLNGMGDMLRRLRSLCISLNLRMMMTKNIMYPHSGWLNGPVEPEAGLPYDVAYLYLVLHILYIRVRFGTNWVMVAYRGISRCRGL